MPGTRISGDVGGNEAVNRISPMDAPRSTSMPHSDYPVSRFLQRIIQESGLRRSEFIRAIGFANTAKGLRRLDEWLVNGSGDEHFLQRIVDRYHPDPVELQSALQKTEAIHQREYQEALHAMEGRERRRFRPFIWVVSEDGAHSWVMAMAQRQIKLLRFPEEFERLSSIEQLRRNTFAIRLLFPGIGAMNRPVQLAQKRTTMTNLDPTEQPATVAAPPRTVRSKKPSPKKGATQKKGAARAKKTAKSADRKKDAKATTPRNGSKGAKILALIGRPGDATLAAITRATGWQAHPVRGFLSVARSQRGLKIPGRPPSIPWAESSAESRSQPGRATASRISRPPALRFRAP
jgi:hypothetical protein